ncbi:MAG: family 1 glycosylhydrolase, partial [Dehalococcoidia bacterium]|nr:family 1 glycosylhydrolase [Dehalococcoidia bacterium]
GWPQRETADAFAAYVDVVTRRLGDRVTRWITLNEPWCSAFLGYHTGEHAPGRTRLSDALAAAHTLLLAHGKAMAVIRANVPDAQAGITVVLSPGYPADDSEAAAAAARRYDGLYNRWWLDPIAGRGYPADMRDWWAGSLPTITPSDLATIAAPIDFLGVNYYFPRRLLERRATDVGRPRELAAPDLAMLNATDVPIPDVPYTAANWPVYPQALTDLLLRLAREYPFEAIYITENGAAFDDPPPVHDRVPDPDRTRYFAAHLGALADAIDQGVPARGYFAWSLYDNFEWAMGYGLRFGVCYTDYATQRRVVKDSGHYLRRVAQANALVDPE